MIGISLKNLGFKYDKTKILDNITLELDYGSINLITGTSGCGKSSLLYLISRIIPDVVDGQISGDIFIDGVNTIDQNIATIANKVGMVIQDPDKQIINDIISDEMAFGQENLGFSKQKISANIKKYSELLKLDVNAFTRCMSGGEKERLLIGSVFAMEQKIILLDEPLANLDQKSIKIVLNNLLDLKKQGYLILIAEHRLSYLRDIVDNAYLLENAKLTKIDINNYCSVQKNSIKIIKNQSTDKIISLSNISYVVAKKELLKDINIDIYSGDRILLLGDNGCGKTTLLKLIAKIIKPSKGEYSEKIINKLKTKKLGTKAWFRQVGYVFQNPNYQLFMPSVKDELNYSSVDMEYLNYLIKNLNLETLLNTHPQALSEGQKRRVCLAAILAAKPKVLLFDEPTVGQDDTNLEAMIRVIDDYARRLNPTIISITHDYRYAKNLSNRIILLDSNTIVEKELDYLSTYFSL